VGFGFSRLPRHTLTAAIIRALKPMSRKYGRSAGLVAALVATLAIACFAAYLADALTMRPGPPAGSDIHLHDTYYVIGGRGAAIIGFSLAILAGLPLPMKIRNVDHGRVPIAPKRTSNWSMPSHITVGTAVANSSSRRCASA